MAQNPSSIALHNNPARLRVPPALARLRRWVLIAENRGKHETPSFHFGPSGHSRARHRPDAGPGRPAGHACPGARLQCRRPRRARPAMAPSRASRWMRGRLRRRRTPVASEQTRAPYRHPTDFRVEVLTDKLSAAWAAAPLPDGKILITERLPGQFRVLDKGNLSQPLTGLDGFENRHADAGAAGCGDRSGLRVQPHHLFHLYRVSRPHSSATRRSPARCWM